MRCIINIYEKDLLFCMAIGVTHVRQTGGQQTNGNGTYPKGINGRTGVPFVRVVLMRTFPPF